jgi:hypothetical protein
MAGTLVANTINTDTGLFATNNAYLGIAKAWVNVNTSSATGSITSSWNVSSVTYNRTGDYTINFTTAMPDANYCMAGVAKAGTSGTQTLDLRISPFETTSSTTSFRCRTVDGPGMLNNAVANYVVFFGN